MFCNALGLGGRQIKGLEASRKLSCFLQLSPKALKIPKKGPTESKR